MRVRSANGKWEAVRIALIVAAACAVQACDQNPASPAGPAVGGPIRPPDSVSIVAATPERGTRLSRGAAVSIDVDVRYELTTVSDARIVLVVQDSKFFSLQSGLQPSAAVARGDGSVHLSTSIRAPEDGRAVHVFVAMARETLATTDVTDSLIYPVP